MQGFSRREVVGWDRFHWNAGKDARLAVREYAATRKLRVAPRRHHDRRTRLTELLDRLRIEVVPRVISHKDEVGEFGPRQISCAPWIDVNHCAGVFHLDAGVKDRHEEDIAALGADPIRGLRRQRDEAH